MYNSSCYLIHCKTNLHAGSGDTNYGIIDKMVQRDPVTELPCIYSSSLKGALREYFENGPEKEAISGFAEGIFGKIGDDDADGGDKSKGNVVFHEAQLIGLPMRSNKKPYFIATSKGATSKLDGEGGFIRFKFQRPKKRN
jgi:CRISPR-associated protein Cmr4